MSYLCIKRLLFLDNSSLRHLTGNDMRYTTLSQTRTHIGQSFLMLDLFKSPQFLVSSALWCGKLLVVFLIT